MSAASQELRTLAEAQWRLGNIATAAALHTHALILESNERMGPVEVHKIDDPPVTIIAA